MHWKTFNLTDEPISQPPYDLFHAPQPFWHWNLDMRSMGEFFELFYLFARARLFQIKEEFQVRRKYYTNPSFKACDLSLCRAYKEYTPYKINKEFLRENPDLTNVYGETPLTTFEKIAKECSLSSNDHIVDLGCGRGRGVFFFSHLLNCKADGVEWISSFVDKANEVKWKHTVKNVAFFNAQLLSFNLRPYSVIYLYGTCLTKKEILTLIKQFKTLKKETKILTVSYPLTDYDAEHFQLVKSFEAHFPWGTTHIYLNQPV